MEAGHRAPLYAGKCMAEGGKSGPMEIWRCVCECMCVCRVCIRASFACAYKGTHAFSCVCICVHFLHACLYASFRAYSRKNDHQPVRRLIRFIIRCNRPLTVFDLNSIIYRNCSLGVSFLVTVVQSNRTISVFLFLSIYHPIGSLQVFCLICFVDSNRTLKKLLLFRSILNIFPLVEPLASSPSSCGLAF